MVSRNILILLLLTATLLYSTQYFLFETFAQRSIANLENNTVTSNSTINEEGSGSSIISPSNPDLQNNFNNWNVISGIWNYSSYLEGGTGNGTSPVDNTIINPTIVENLSSITTAFRINEMDTNLTNYANIVYSFIDPETYKKAGIYVINDDIFVRFAEIENGSVVPEPLHPYISTGLKWKVGNTFNLTLDFQDNIQSLILNGTQYAGKIDYNVDGLTGLNYGRIIDMDFFNFAIQSMNAPNQNNGNEQSMNVPNQNNETKSVASESLVVSDSQSIMLGEKSLPSNSFIPIYDSSPYKIVEGHIAAKLPCSEDNAADVQIVMGQINEMEVFNLVPVTESSDPGSLCHYVTDIISTNERTITDIAIQNNSTEDVEFPSTSSLIISVNKIAELS
ncbi:putative Cell Surface protein [Candidatus Nitrosocosmicus arcticus]|uniref:Putative Cell Surface protein n=2 Tax=Candidatus Nitrosocosmicus arcticus TaxID=2035267 RepID=A0A557SYM6_9ARCH|nr:putative Cell Surface protein [Candidatus Nitrosocosmicus arcticus]